MDDRPAQTGRWRILETSTARRSNYAHNIPPHILRGAKRADEEIFGLTRRRLRELRRYLRRKILMLEGHISNLSPENVPANAKERRHRFLYVQYEIRLAQHRDVCRILRGDKPLGRWPVW